MLWRREWPAPMAAVMLLLGTGLFGWVAFPPAPPESPVLPPSNDSAGLVSPRRRIPRVRSREAAIQADPFRPSRQPPAERFRMPGEPRVEGSQVVIVAATDSVRLLGTAMLGASGGFAMCQWGAEPVRTVRIGEEVRGWTLRAIAPGHAVFRTATGETRELSVRRTVP